MASAFKVMLVAVAMASAQTTHAAEILEVTFSGAVEYQYDYASGMSETPTVPLPITVHATIPISSFNVVDYGATTIVYFPLGTTIIHDPLINYVGIDPVGNGLADFGKSAYTFTDTNDYASGFITEFAFQDNIYNRSGDDVWTYHTEIRLDNRFPALSGDGSSDYALTPSLLRSFLFENIGNPIGYYNSSWQHYSVNEFGNVTYHDGKSWSSYSMTLTAVSFTSAVPEPSIWLMLILGFGIVGRHLRKQRSEQRAIYI